MQEGELPDGAMKPGNFDDEFMDDTDDSGDDDEVVHGDALVMGKHVTMPFVANKHLLGAYCILTRCNCVQQYLG